MSFAGLTVSGQAIIIFIASLALIVALWLFFERSLAGKALRATAVNRLGCAADGHSPAAAQAGCRSRWPPSSAALSGLLIGPTTTVFYDSGFLIGLKGFRGRRLRRPVQLSAGVVWARWAWGCWRASAPSGPAPTRK